MFDSSNWTMTMNGPLCMSRDSSVGIVTGYRPDDTISRSTLGYIQPPIQWVLEALSLGVKQPGHEANHSPRSSAEVKEHVEVYLHSPNTSSRCGAYLSTRTTLPLTLPLVP
jgi:hypothetical protein